jgi:hypothetical protein
MFTFLCKNAIWNYGKVQREYRLLDSHGLEWIRDLRLNCLRYFLKRRIVFRIRTNFRFQCWSVSVFRPLLRPKLYTVKLTGENNFIHEMF